MRFEPTTTEFRLDAQIDRAMNSTRTQRQLCTYTENLFFFFFYAFFFLFFSYLFVIFIFSDQLTKFLELHPDSDTTNLINLSTFRLFLLSDKQALISTSNTVILFIISWSIKKKYTSLYWKKNFFLLLFLFEHFSKSFQISVFSFHL